MTKIQNPIYWLLILACISPLLHRPLATQEVLLMQIIVKSDRLILPDNFLTLHEAIEIINSTLSQNKLSATKADTQELSGKQIATKKLGQKDRFSVTLGIPKLGRVSAIAPNSQYGMSNSRPKL